MEAYLCVFVNYKLNDWAWLLLMAEFAYNNTKNASMGYTLFELNYDSYFKISYHEDIDPQFK